ncbi:MAG: hypothetical protein HYZ57_17495 [Acidobacteria bacterium]|nr:hypothetical protein [Acidobacteriota bacterium]
MSRPRGPDCWVETQKACPIHARRQPPVPVISIGMGQAAGWNAVPELSAIRNISAGFIGEWSIAARLAAIPGMAW